MAGKGRTEIFKDCEFWFARLHPDRPNKKFSKTNPTWEVQVRTHDIDQAKKWKAAGLLVKKDEYEGDNFYRTTMVRRNYNEEGKENEPPRVVTGDLKRIENPDIIGNGSKGSVKLYLYPSDQAKTGTGHALLAVQVTYLKEYSENDFEEEEFVVEAHKSLDDDFSPKSKQKQKDNLDAPSTKSRPKSEPKLEEDDFTESYDDDDDIPF